jgi:hypothetical protein
MTTIESPCVVRNLLRSVFGLGVLTLVLGAVVLIWPGDSIVVASVVFGVYLLVSGIAQAIAAFTVDMSPGSSSCSSSAAHCRSCWATWPSAIQQRRSRVDAGHLDRCWLHLAGCLDDRVGD